MRKRKAVSKHTGVAVKSDLVFWGIVDGVRGATPVALIEDRRYAQLLLGLLPEELRGKVHIQRTYITIQLTEGQRRPRRES